jgi:uncharacterized membrane protein
MSSYVLPYIIAFVVFLIIDVIWLSTAGRLIYVPDLRPILREEPNLVIAFIFYIIFVAGLTYFVIVPSLSGRTLAEAAIVGAFFGLVAYATYDLTNLSTLRDFTVRVAVIDTIWGAVLASAVTTATILLLRLFGRA